MLVNELKPQFSSNKSYYGKATVIELDNGVRMLKSYYTIVCIITTWNDDKTIDVFLPWKDWSRTTGKHVWDFLLQNHIQPNFSEYGFKSFAAFMREVGKFKWDTQTREIVEIDDNTWVGSLQNLLSAGENFKEL